MERGCARAEEQVFRTRWLMLSGPVAESESRLDSKLSTLSGEKDTELRTAVCNWVRWVQKAIGLGHKINKQTQSFSIQPFHVKCQLCSHLR